MRCAKVVQIECRKTNLFEFYAEVQRIYCKGTNLKVQIYLMQNIGHG